MIKIVKGIVGNRGRGDFQEKNEWEVERRNPQIRYVGKDKDELLPPFQFCLSFFLVIPFFRAEFDVTEQKSCRYTLR